MGKNIHVRSIIIVFLLTFLILSISFYIYKKDRLHYKEKGNIEYKVYLKENDYFEEKYLENKETYISSLIDYIKLNYIYSFNSSNNFNYNYKYYAIGRVDVYDKASKLLYTKEETLLKEDIIKGNNNSYNINKTIDINYDKYNKIVNNFKNNSLFSVDSFLIIEFYIQLNGNYNDNDFETKNIMSIKIPLSEQTVDVKITSNNIDNSNFIDI